MKHLVIILPFLLSFYSYGQKYSVGVKVAPLIDWPSFGDKVQKDTFSRGVSVGYSVAALISFPLKKDFDVFIEGGYSQKGRRLKFEDKRWINNSTYRFIDATLLLRKSFKFRLEKNVPSYFFVNLGPEVSYWAGSKGQLIVNGNEFDYNVVFNEPADGNFYNMYLNDVNRWLFGLVVGVGIKAPLLRGQHITTELRFVSGHTFLGERKSSHIEILNYNDTMLTNLKVISLNFSYTLDFDVQQSRKGKSTLNKKLKQQRRR